MLQRETRTSAILLLAIIVVGTLASPVPNSMASQASGCPLHHHSPISPLPVQDHSCCQSGHDTAVVQKLVKPGQVLIASPLLDSSQSKISPDVGARFRSEIAALGIPNTQLQLRV